MNTSLVPSLQHLSSSRVVTSLFSHLDVERRFQGFKYVAIKCQVKDAILCLTSCTRVQEKLEKFIDPLIEELEGCLDFFRNTEYGFESVRFDFRESISRCWLSDGTIDREKLARLVFNNLDPYPVNRFIFATTFCFFGEALDAWNALLKIEKVYLKHKRSSSIVKLWIEWLESDSTKDWESFVAWSLGTPLWHSSVPFLKHALETLNSEERRQYFVNALMGKEVGDYVMRFCISVMTKDEQEQILKESTVQVFSCMLSWPLRTVFFDRKNNLWPYLTEHSFRNVLKMILKKIRNQKTNDVEHLIALRDFWEESPGHFQNAAKCVPQLFDLVQMICGLDLSPFLKSRESWWSLFNVYDRCFFFDLLS